RRGPGPAGGRPGGDGLGAEDADPGARVPGQVEQLPKGILARFEAIDAGVDEALLLDARGCVTEGTGDNVFAVRGRRLRTPPALNILEGITRETLLGLAPRAGLEPEVADLTPYDLYT